MNPSLENADERGCPQIDADVQRLQAISQITERVIGAAYTVANTLGVGFLEKVYENALACELRNQGVRVDQQRPVDVYYDGLVVGTYVADLVVEDCVPIELKVAKTLDDAHRPQCINHLRATRYRIGLLINFGTPKVEIKRIANPQAKPPIQKL